jgi:hypothetical protein
MYESKDIPSMNPTMYTLRCQAVVPPTPEACGKPATHIVHFQDGDKIRTCQNCALYLGQLAGTHGTNIKTERLEG